MGQVVFQALVESLVTLEVTVQLELLDFQVLAVYLGLAEFLVSLAEVAILGVAYQAILEVV